MNESRVYRIWLDFTFRQMPRVMAFLVFSSSAFLVVLLFSQVWLRYIFQLPLLWVEEVALIPAFWLYLLGAAYGTYERSHIKVDIVHLLAKKEKRRLVVRFLASLTAFLATLLLMSWGYDLFKWDLALGPRSSTLRIPYLYAHCSLLLVPILFAYYFMVETVDLARQAFSGKRPLFVKED